MLDPVLEGKLKSGALEPTAGIPSAKLGRAVPVKILRPNPAEVKLFFNDAFHACVLTAAKETNK